MNKARVAKAYNKRVKKKSFVEGDLVWKTIFPIRTKDHEFGKWSANWEGKHCDLGNSWRCLSAS